MTDIYDFIVIGDGIAARLALFELSRNKSFCTKNILHIAKDELYPACTYRTTSVVSDGVHEVGLSPLGDILVKSLHAFKDFYHQYQSEVKDFILPGPQYYLDKPNVRINNPLVLNGVSVHEGQAYLVRSHALNNWLTDKFQSAFTSYEFRNQNVIKVLNEEGFNLSLIELSDGTILKSKKTLLCTGAYTPFIYKNPLLPEGKPVSGSYYEWHNVKLEKSFVVTDKHYNIIYRHFDNTLLFGGTSHEGFIFDHNISDLNKGYSLLKKEFSLNSLPEIEEAQVFTGIRHKGKKRMPNYFLDKNIIVINALYKNGFSFPFYFSKKMVSDLQEK